MNNKALARILLKESISPDGLVDSARVSAACDYVQEHVPTMRALELLREYMRMLKPVLASETSTIESSGELSPEALALLEDFVRKESGRDLYFEKKINPELLGGIRITCGDNVWENSASSLLEDIASGNYPS